MSVSVTRNPGATWLTLLRPPVNAIDLPTTHEMIAQVEGADPDKPLVLTGKGRSFCGGVDTALFAEYDSDTRRDFVLSITRMVRALVCHPRPVIAAINGHAVGGGLVLALTADYRIAGCGNDARFGLTEANAGVPFPAGPAEVIRNEIPSPLLRRLTLTSGLISRDELHSAGLFDLVCQPDDLAAQAGRLARALTVQAAFAPVKAQVRARLQAALNALVASGEDPFMDAFL